MTRLAIFADIHGNREALDACLTDARTHGAEKFVFLGDLVGYGADPCYVVDRVAHAQSEGAIVLKGNHDAAIADRREEMNVYARASIDWTRKQFSPKQCDFLAGLPLTAELDEVLFVHADAAHPLRWTYVTSSVEAQRSMRATPKHLTLCGHVHKPQLYRTMTYGLPAAVTPASGEAFSVTGPLKWLAVVGSVGQPRDDNPEAAYALYDTATGQLTFARTAYDIEGAAKKIRAAGLPDLLAARLFVGR